MVKAVVYLMGFTLDCLMSASVSCRGFKNPTVSSRLNSYCFAGSPFMSLIFCAAWSFRSTALSTALWLERRRLHKGVLAERNDDDALTALADVERQRIKRNTDALLAHAQEPANADDDGADLTLAVENEILDIADGLASRVVHGLADEHAGEPLVGWLLRDEARGRPSGARMLGQRLAERRSCGQSQCSSQCEDLQFHRISPLVIAFLLAHESLSAAFFHELLGAMQISVRTS
jgi:hypothetical protein